jgi:hypothetical protein
MLLVASRYGPIATNNKVIPLDQIHTDMERILSDPHEKIGPSNLVMRVKVPVRAEMEDRAALEHAAGQFAGNHLYKVQQPPIAVGSAEKAALEEAVKNLPRQYASPAARPKRPCPPACGQERIVAVVK